MILFLRSVNHSVHLYSVNNFMHAKKKVEEIV